MPRIIRINVDPDTYFEALNIAEYWQRALREAREMKQEDPFNCDMWYEMLMYRDHDALEGVLQGAYWAAWAWSCPVLRQARDSGFLYLAYRPDCKAAEDVSALLERADLPYPCDSEDIVSDSHAGQPFSRNARIAIRKGRGALQLELVVWPPV